jgi:hypothetical protein
MPVCCDELAGLCGDSVGDLPFRASKEGSAWARLLDEHEDRQETDEP